MAKLRARAPKAVALLFYTLLFSSLLFYMAIAQRSPSDRPALAQRSLSVRRFETRRSCILCVFRVHNPESIELRSLILKSAVRVSPRLHLVEPWLDAWPYFGHLFDFATTDVSQGRDVIRDKSLRPAFVNQFAVRAPVREAHALNVTVRTPALPEPFVVGEWCKLVRHHRTSRAGSVKTPSNANRARFSS